MMDRSKPAPGYDVDIDEGWFRVWGTGGDRCDTVATEAEAIAATWAAYDSEHADAIADFAERAAAKMRRPYPIDSLDDRQIRCELADWLVAFARAPRAP